MVFDKTGTLTLGKMQLASIEPAAGVSDNEVLRWSAAAESSARHPLADAVQAAAQQAGVELPHSSGSKTVPGSGVTATVDGHRCGLLACFLTCVSIRSLIQGCRVRKRC